MVSCDGDDVTVAPPGTTTIEPNTQTVTIPTGPELAGQSFSQYVIAGADKAALPAGYKLTGIDTFADANTINIGGTLFDFTKVDSSTGFALQNLAPQAGHAGATTQAVVDATLTNLPAGVLTPAHVDATLANTVNTTAAHSVATGNTPLAGLNDLEDALVAISQNNLLLAQVNALLTGKGNNAGGSLSIVGIALQDSNAVVLEVTGTDFNDITKIDNADASNALARSLGVVYAATPLDPNHVDFVGYMTILDFYNTNIGYQNGSLENDINQAVTYLNGLKTDIAAANAALLNAVNNDANLSQFAAVNDYDITFTIDEQFGTDFSISRQGNFTSSVTCTIPSIVTLTAATNGFNVGDSYVDAATTTTVSGSNNGAFTIQQVNP